MLLKPTEENSLSLADAKDISWCFIRTGCFFCTINKEKQTSLRAFPSERDVFRFTPCWPRQDINLTCSTYVNYVRHQADLSRFYFLFEWAFLSKRYYGLIPRWKCEINPAHLGNIPSGALGYSYRENSHILWHLSDGPALHLAARKRFVNTALTNFCYLSM